MQVAVLAIVIVGIVACEEKPKRTFAPLPPSYRSSSEPTREPEPPLAVKCRTGPDCVEHGWCTPNPTKPGNCGADVEADCGASNDCKRLGFCSLGLHGTCAARGDADCEQGSENVAEGRTKYVPLDVQDCVRPMTDRAADATSTDCWGTKACHDEGRCVLRGDTCAYAKLTDQCLASTGCARWGRCSLVRGQCVAASAKDCNAGSKTQGQAARDGLCVNE